MDSSVAKASGAVRTGMKRWQLSLIVIGIVIVLADTSSARVMPIRLEAMAQQADAIVIGHVERIRTIEGLPVAEVRVLRSLKGAGVSLTVWILAQGTWTCDISEAVTGETALWFLSSSTMDLYQLPPDKERLERLRTALQDRPLFFIAASGRGRMPIRRVDETDYADAWVGDSGESDIVFPHGLQLLPGPSLAEWGGHADAFRFVQRLLGMDDQPGDTPIRSIKLADLTAAIDQSLHQSDDSITSGAVRGNLFPLAVSHSSATQTQQGGEE